MIFISIAAFHEPLLAQTIADACHKAERPDELVFGVVDQHPHNRRAELQALYPNLKLRYVHVHPVDARGVCWARALCFSMYRGEAFVLQIDSHMIFELAWDGRLQQQIRTLSRLSAKPLVTNYPWGFEMRGRTPVVDPHRTLGVTLFLKPHPDTALSDHCATLRFVADQIKTDQPVRACHIAAGFFFTLGQFVDEVPYDPQLYFHGEEQSLALRAYTRGWDLFHMEEIPLYHLYKRGGNENEGLHWHSRWSDLRDISYAEATRHADERLMDLVYERRDLGVYGLGQQRSLDDYARDFGIDYRKRHLGARPDLEHQGERPIADLNRPEAVEAGGDTAASLSVVEINPHHPRPFVFTDAARSITASLCASGIAAGHVVNRIPPQGGLIVLGWTPGWLAAHAHQLDPQRTFIFNAEQLGSTGSDVVTTDYLRALSTWSVLDYHESNAEFLRARFGPSVRVTTVPLIPGPAVEYPVDMPTPDDATSVDVLFYGTLNERRQRTLDEIRKCGLTVEVVSGSYGQELAPALLRCKLVLHVHYYPSALFPMLRMLQPLARGVPIVCERSVFSRWNDWSESGMVFADYDSLAQACVDLVKDPERGIRSAAQCRSFAQSLKMVGL